MKRLLQILVTFSIFLPSCEKNTIPVNNIPEGYPATYSKLSSGILTRMRSSYESRNPFVTSSLTDYGFTGYNGDPLGVGIPPYQGQTSQTEAEGIIRSFVKSNGLETGVKNPDALSFNQAFESPAQDGIAGWYFNTYNQKIDTIEVLNSSFSFQVINGSVTFCLGNWFPDIYIPSDFNYSIEKAKKSLIGDVVSHSSIAGQISDITIKQADIDKSTTRLKILPQEIKNKIELHVCWEINIPGPVYYLVYFDVITGEIILETPTIFSF